MKRYKYNPIEFSLLEQSPVPYAIYQFIDQRVVTIALSAGFMELFGYDDREAAYDLMDNNMYRDVHPDDVARIEKEALYFAAEDGDYNVIYRSKKIGEYRVIHAKGRHIYPEDGVRLAVVWYTDEGAYIGSGDVQEDLLTREFSVSLRESSMHRKTNYDFLTGLPNMTYFFELVKPLRDQAASSGKRCALCFANLNGMKYYNKKFGFAEGDKLLRLFADLLVKYFGSERSCRIAQDNYVFFSYTDGLDRTLESLFMEFEVMTGKRGVSVRVGIYPSDMGYVDTSLACDRARYACNTIKNASCSASVKFDKSMLEYETNRQYVIDHLDQAIEEGWLQAYFQPLVRTANGRVCDEEALARWIDPVKGMLSPAEFIPVLEDAKLIYKVDLHMVDLIIKKLKAQAQMGLYLVPNSVNLSRTDFDACDMVEEICKKMDAAGVPRRLLTIEITESVLGSDFDFMKKQVERFRSQGFQVWMDDFGSGYSSLDVLQSIQFDVIKLDMRFMKQFNNDEKSRVIITELMKMALGLGIETVSEGVERQDQVDFLSRIGCTKIQGYYYCKPISMEGIFERYEKGAQIGFENPEESEYFEAIGRINLYDAVALTREEQGTMGQYFNTLPMAVVGIDDTYLKVIRCNESYREYLIDTFHPDDVDAPVPYAIYLDGFDSAFAKALKKCADTGERVFLDERLGSDSTIRAFIRRIAHNPVTGVTACGVVILGISRDTGQGVTYSDVANSLSTDYIHMYYVNLETDNFIEYTPDSSADALVVERRGTDFFAASRRDAMQYIYPEDAKQFVEMFYKENILRCLDENGAFTCTYRLLVNGAPVYVHLKAVRMSRNENYIIIGVSNIDAQMRARKHLERLREERISYARIAALTGNYIVIYIVDPKTGHFEEYDATTEFDELNIAKGGDDFFAASREETLRIICPEDLPLFEQFFTKEKMIEEIEENGVFMMIYRLMINGKPNFINLKAAMVQEVDGPKLVVGVSDIDSQIRRDMEYKVIPKMPE